MNQVCPRKSDARHRTYAYDNRGRLTNVQDYYGYGCTTRAYSFSLDSDRTSLNTSTYAADGSCSTSSPTTKTSTFATDDKITNTGYTYDAFGRTQTVPAADTDQTGGGALSIDYYANDMVAHLAQNTPTSGSPLSEKTYGLDSLQRIANTTSATGGVDLRKTTNHYSDSSDTPAWTDVQTRPDAATAWTTSWTRNVNGPDGDLGIIEKSDGTSRIQLTNLHGDIVSTMANTTSTSTALENYADSTEYGTPEPGFPTLGQQYSWLGTKQRSTDTIGGLTLMGARLYNPTTGLFLSQDPVAGGNDNPYVYPPDPVNHFDIGGRASSAKCRQLLRKIIQLKNRVARRSRQFRENARGFKKGSRAYRGHVQAFKNDQQGLRKLLNEFNHCGCGRGLRLPRGVWKLATRKVPIAAAAAGAGLAVWLALKWASPVCGPFVFACAVAF